MKKIPTNRRQKKPTETKKGNKKETQTQPQRDVEQQKGDAKQQQHTVQCGLKQK